MNLSNPKSKNQIIFISTYLLLIVVNTQLASFFGITSMMEWWINTIFLFAAVVLFTYSLQKKMKTIYKILAIPVSWLVHGILTIPAALILGILKYDPEHLRTAGEHRAVFILASIPLIILGMRNSKLF